ncbi:hypothetical protein CH063_01422 [Colletotrichum higginsianum]|uniref:Uncharacterized protein n=1 Tax=Colletotrichum higginsianum (strain IMI 349063) TaxID=759273 RepID=H1V731_COLHI|nr:hypothetical protein CH063_01422 [Colletotrichum higginsianum]
MAGETEETTALAACSFAGLSPSTWLARLAQLDFVSNFAYLFELDRLDGGGRLDHFLRLLSVGCRDLWFFNCSRPGKLIQQIDGPLSVASQCRGFRLSRSGISWREVRFIADVQGTVRLMNMVAGALPAQGASATQKKHHHSVQPLTQAKDVLVSPLAIQCPTFDKALLS